MNDPWIHDGDDEFLINRAIYRDPAVYELEMKFIFERAWNLVGLESQAPKPHDFFTGHIGRAPIIVTRDGNGVLHCLLNTCRHKGAMVCHLRHGNARHFVCQYHGWAYSSAGANIYVKDHAKGAYNASFDAKDHDLQPVARFASYRGVLFASLHADVPDLAEHLGDARKMIDLVVDQSPHGVECVPGRGAFIYKGNWKLQMENGVDPYHFSSTHPSYIAALQRRAEKGSVYSSFNSSDLQRGTFAFENGHNAMWGPSPSDKATPLSFVRDELVSRNGETKARWMTYVRNTTIFPNAQFAENASLQLRIWRPLAADRTAMVTYCLAPIGEPAEARRMRIRQYEEFFNPTGLATPDDIANYEGCQRGFEARPVVWQQGSSRGETLKGHCDNHESLGELGVRPVSTVVGSFELGDETVMHPTYRRWLSLIAKGIDEERAAASTGSASV